MTAMLVRTAKRSWKCCRCGESIDVGEPIVHPLSIYRGVRSWEAGHPWHWEES